MSLGGMVGLFQTSPVEVRNPPLPKAMLEIPYLLRLRVDISFSSTEPFPYPPESPPSDSSVNYRNPASPRPRQHRFSHQQGSNPDSTVSSMPTRGAGRLRSVPFSTSRPRADGTQRPAFFFLSSLNVHLSGPRYTMSRLSKSLSPSHSEAGSRKATLSFPLLSFSNVSLHCGETPPPAPHP